jgi:putative glutamine amidotransferase
MKPVIGVTTSRRGGRRSFSLHRFALWRAGAKAVRLTAESAIDRRRLDGLLIGGGDDIGAEIYAGEVLPDVRVDPERDTLELDLLHWSVPAGMPVLGVCRGAQMINVALGGSLHTDIYEVYEKAPKMRTVLPRKRISTVEGSRLDGILRCNPCMVNALHHQSVDRLGTGLRIAGYDDAEIVQALEGTADSFLLGVQWHPELLPFSRPQRRLFSALVSAARAWRTCRGDAIEGRSGERHGERDDDVTRADGVAGARP